MKSLITILAVTGIVCITAQAVAAGGAPSPRDAAAMIKLSQLEARKSMLGFCGVTGDEAEKDLAADNAKAAELEASLSDAGKASLPDTRAKIDTGVKASWESTPEEQRAKSCDALKTTMASEK